MMRQGLHVLVTTLAIFFAAGCGDDDDDDNPAIDGGNPAVDAATNRSDAAERCGTATTSCGGVEPICDPGTGRCRGCNLSSECAARDSSRPICVFGRCNECATSTDCQNPARPFCDLAAASHCRACAADRECASGICDESVGMCVAESSIVHAAPGAEVSPCGDAATPCGTLTTALGQVTATRKWILATGRFTEALVVSGPTQAALVGPMATLLGPTGQPALRVDTRANLSVEGIVMTGASDGTDAVRCMGGPGATTTLLIRNAKIEDSSGVGLSANACDLTLDRVQVRRNRGGGVALTASAFLVRNSFVVQNGSDVMPISALGGLAIDGNPPAGGGAKLEFTTIADNRGGAVAGGLACSNVSVARLFGSSILHGNGGAQLAGANCSFDHSDLAPGGPSNINADPLFVDRGNGDYHLSAASPCKDTGNNLGAPSFDYDGDPRPSPVGGTADMGADELP